MDEHESSLFLLSLIFVKMQSGKTISLPLYPGCTVEDMKQLIQNQEGISDLNSNVLCLKARSLKVTPLLNITIYCPI